MKRQDIFSSLMNTRRSKGITQIQLSDLLNLPQSYISQVEQGKHDIKTSTLSNWARVLDLELMLVPRQQLPAVSYLIQTARPNVQEIPSAYGPLPDEVE